MSMKTLRPAGFLVIASLLLGAVALPVRLAAAEASSTTGTASKPKAPEWKAQNLDGKTVSSTDFKGKVVVVDFWATWCGPCVSEIPGYVELQRKYADRGLIFVGLSLDEGGPEVVRKFVKAHKVNYTVGLSNEQVQAAFGGFEVIPTTFVIDREGRIHFKKTGAMAPAEFEAIVKPLL